MKARASTTHLDIYFHMASFMTDNHGEVNDETLVKARGFSSNCVSLLHEYEIEDTQLAQPSPGRASVKRRSLYASRGVDWSRWLSFLAKG